MATSKKPQLKKSSPTATKIRTAERRKLAREAAKEEDRRQQAIRNELRRASMPKRSEEEMVIRNRVVRGLGGVLRLVASSYPEWDNNVTFAVELDHRDSLTAYTDFKQIVVRFPRSKFVVESDGNFSNEVTRSSIAQVLGVGYHEVGHVLYTVPFATVRAETAESLGLEIDHQQSWNALEDQRMEVAVTDGSPDIAAYFTAMFANHFLSSPDADPGEVWWLACGRLYLPENVRAVCRDEFVAKYGEAVEDQLHTIVKTYCTATTIQDLARAVLAYDSLWKATHPKGGKPGNGGGPSGTAPHENYRYSREDPSKAKEKLSKSAADAEKFDKADASGETGQSGSDGAPSREGTGHGRGAGSDEQPDRSKTSEDSKTDDGAGSVSDALKEAKEQAEQQADSDGRVDSALNAIKETAAAGYLPYINGQGFYMQDDDIQRAEALSSEFERSLEVANAYNAPSWRRRQEQGAVDPAIYRTRRPGDPEFRRTRTGDGSKGFDVSLSLVLDVSGSMGGAPIHTLSVVQYAIKKACWSLGIPCTVTAFSNAAELVSDCEDAPEPVGLEAGGGTNPVPALRAAVQQRGDKRDHLVILLTDGDCEDGRNEVADLQSMGAHVLGVAVGWGNTSTLQQRLGCDEVRSIQECEELARIVEDWLAVTVSVGR